MYPFKEAASILKIVAHPVRLGIIELLDRKKYMNVKNIQEELGLKQSITSQHLNALSRTGVLIREKKANEVYYSIGKKEVIRLLACIRGCCKN